MTQRLDVVDAQRADVVDTVVVVVVFVVERQSVSSILTPDNGVGLSGFI